MAAPTTKISARTFTLSQRLLAGGGDTSFTVSKNSTDVFTVSNGFLWIGTGVKAEWAYFAGATVSSTSITFTSVVRGIKPGATSTSDNDSTLQYDHAIGDTVIYVLHSVDINKYLQKDADDTITGSLDFTGTSTFKFKFPRFTTAQRDALTTADGIVIYNTTTGEAQYCSGGSWYTFSAGSTQPLGSDTVAGRLKLDVAASDIANPIAAGINSPHVLDTTSTTTTGQIKIANNTTGSRSATLSLHGDDTYTSGAFIVARSSAGVNALTTETHRGTGEHSVVHSENANYYLNTGTGVFKADSDIITAFTAGETLVAGNCVYMKQSDNKVYKSDYTTVEKAVQFVGIVIVGGAANATVFVQQAGVYTTSALTAGQAYYLSNTAGALGGVPSFQSVSIIPMEIGIALSTTKLLIRPRRMQRVIPFNNTRTAASGSGTQTITIGGATPFLIGRVEISSVLPGANFCTGSYDATTGANLYVFNGTSVANAGTSYCVAVDDAGGNWKGVGGVSTYDFTIAWTKTTAPATVYFSGLVYESI